MLKFHFSKTPKNLPQKPAVSASKENTILFEEGANMRAMLVCRQRMFFAILGFLLIYAVLTFRVFDLCLADGLKLPSLDDEAVQKHANAVMPIARADIVDRNGTVLATSLPTVNLYANPKNVRHPEEVAEQLTLLFPEIGYDELLAKLTRPKTSFSLIKYNLSPAQQSAVNNLGIPALEFQNSEKRVYPHNNLFSHVLGYTNIDNLGLAGLEKSMHKRLTESTKPLELTIDLGIQDTIREELLKAVEKFKAEGATAILLDVNTGGVIAMVSVPDFNPNQNIPVGDRALFNFATQGVYEAGSVFKTFNTALGLESGKVKVGDKFDATKPIKIQGLTVSDFKGENRWLSVGEILIYSSNIGSAQLVSRVGREAQRKFLQNMGFSEPLSKFEISEKARPLFLSEKRWRDDTMATVSYGYGISVTPLHLISAFAALMNGGIYRYPHILKNADVPAPRRVISEKTSVAMRPLLRDVVLYGSAKKANIEGYPVAGKTGTANKLVNGHYVEKKVMTSFISAFPFENPQYALLVVLDEPKGSKETWGYVTSGWNAAPTGGNIIKEIAPQLNIPAEFDLESQRKHIQKTAHIR